MNLISNRIWAAIRLAAVYLLARYACDFSMIQSVFLTAFAGLSIEAVILRHSVARRFQPFCLWIRPNYVEILLDAGVLANETEYSELLKANNLTGDDLFKGITCWILSYNPDADTHTIAWPEWKRYTSRLEHRIAGLDLETLPLSAAFPAGCRAANGKLRAGFELKLGHSGIHLRMCIDEQWWKARWPDSVRVRPSFDEHVESWEGIVNLTVAVIPYEELQYAYRWKPEWGRVSLKRRASVLETLGWTDSYHPVDQIQGNIAPIR